MTPPPSDPPSPTGILRSWYSRQNYDPGPWGWLVNPFYFARRELRRHLGDVLPQLSGAVLDVGCGSMPYRHLVHADRYVGLDHEGSLRREENLADVYYDGRTFPLGDDEFDGALCSQVLEHVFNPDEFLVEIHRVLRPGGRLVLTVPFVWDEHEQPFDCARYSSFGLKALLERAGFQIVEHRKTLADVRLLFQLGNAYLFKVTRSGRPRLDQLCAVLLMAPVNLVGILLGWIMPRNPDFYLDHIVVAQKSETGAPASASDSLS